MPTYAALANRPAGWLWTGIFSRNTADYNGYLSIVEEVRQGASRTHNLFTAEPHHAFQVRPFYFFLGLLGRLMPSLSGVALMEIGRFIAILWFLIVLSKLVRRIYDTNFERLVAFLIVVLGSGLGWLRWTPDPPDLRIVETSTFLALLSPPLYCESLALFAGILFCLEGAWSAKSNSSRLRYSLIAGIQALWLGFDRPFSLAPLSAAVGISAVLFVMRSRAKVRQLLLSALLLLCGTGIAITYQIVALRSIPVYAAWNRQHILPTPDVVRMLLACGLLLPLAIAGLRRLFRIRPYLTALVSCYAILSFAFSRFPVQFQERFLEGMPLCLALLAGSGVIAILEKFPSTVTRKIGACIFIALLMPSSIVGILKDYKVLKQRTAPQFLPSEMIEAINSLKQIAAPGEAILSAESSGNFIPAYSARPVVLGQQVQTASFLEKRRLVTSVLSENIPDAKRRQLLAKSGARYFFWGPEERALSQGHFQPDKAGYLQQVYANRMVKIYRIL